MRIEIIEKYKNKTLANGLNLPIITPIEIDKKVVNISTMNDVLENEVHIAIAKSIIKKIGGMVTIGKDGELKPHRSGNACLDIINSGFTQEIFFDICQSIAETLINWYANDSCFGVVKVADNKLVFDTYSNKNGIEKSYYNKLFGVVESVLYDFSNHSVNNKGVIINIDSIIVDDDGEQFSLSNKSTRYLKNISYDGAIGGVIRRADFKSFIDFVEKSKLISDTKMKSFLMVICGLLDGMNSDEIANYYNLGVATVKRRRVDIKNVYDEWIKNGGKIDISNNKDDVWYGNVVIVGNGSIATNSGYFDGITTSEFTSGNKCDFGYDNKYDIYGIDMDNGVELLEWCHKHIIGNGFIMSDNAYFLDTTDTDTDGVRYNSDSKVILKNKCNMIDVYYDNKYIHSVPKH